MSFVSSTPEPHPRHVRGYGSRGFRGSFFQPAALRRFLAKALTGSAAVTGWRRSEHRLDEQGSSRICIARSSGSLPRPEQGRSKARTRPHEQCTRDAPKPELHRPLQEDASALSAPDVRGWEVCRFRGARGDGPRGQRNGHYKHGRNMRECAGERRAVSVLVNRTRFGISKIEAPKPQRGGITLDDGPALLKSCERIPTLSGHALPFVPRGGPASKAA